MSNTEQETSTVSSGEASTYTHLVRDTETGAILDYCTSAEQAARFAHEENAIAFAGQERAVVEPLS